MGFPNSNLYDGQTHYQDGRLYSYDNSNGTWIHTVDMTPFHHWTCNMSGYTDGKLTDWGLYPRSGRTIGTAQSVPSTTYKIQSSADLTDGDYFQCETKSHYSSGGTFSCWFKVNVSSPPDVGGLFYLESSSGYNHSFVVFFYYYNNRIMVRWSDTECETDGDKISFNDNEWHHICSTNSLSLGSITYLDGEVVGSASISECHIYDDSDIIYVGTASASSGGTLYPFYGYIEDARYYNRAITSYEVSVIYNKSYGTYNQSSLGGSSHNFIPYTWLKMQETRQDEQNIGGFRSEDMIAFSGITTNNTGKIGKSWYFNESTSLLSGNTLSISGTRHSLSFWLKDTSTTVSNRWWFYSDGSDNSPNSSRWRIYEQNSGTIHMLHKSLYPHVAAIFSIVSGWKDEWNHFVVVFNGDVAKSYYNGSYNTIFTDNTNSGFTMATDFAIGSKTDGTNKIKGYMEDFRIYDYCLHPNEIKNIYNDGKGVLY